MDRVASYEDDIYAWSREQAAVLRRLADTRRDLPNELDLANVAEEIEDVGKTELHRVESFSELLLLHLVKLASAPPNASPVRKWLIECDLQQRRARKDFRRSMLRQLDLDEVWSAACKRADAALEDYGEQILPGLPPACPFTWDELAADRFDIADSVARIRAAAAPQA